MKMAGKVNKCSHKRIEQLKIQKILKRDVIKVDKTISS